MLTEARIIRELETQRKLGLTSTSGLCNAVLRAAGHPALSENGVTVGFVRDAFAVLSVIDHRKQPVRKKVSTLTLREQVADYINRCGIVGATDEEIAIALKIGGNTVRPRRVELLEAGRIARLDHTRANISGRRANIWVNARKVA